LEPDASSFLCQLAVNVKKILGKPNLWLLRVRLYSQGEDNKTKKVQFHGTRAEAEKRWVELRDELKNGFTNAKGEELKVFGDVLNLYRKKSEQFSESHQSRFNQLLNDLGNAPLELFVERLEDHIELRRTTPSKTGRPLANASVNRLMQMVKAAFNVAVEMELIEKSPINRTRFKKLKEVSRDRSLTPEEKIKLLDTLVIEAPHLYPMIRYAMLVPCRKSELINMRKTDLDLVAKAIRVRNGTTKNDEGIWKPIPTEMLDYFQTLPADCPYMFYRLEKDGYHSLGDFKNAWKRCLRLAGISDFRHHDLRHISASDMVDNGTPEQIVMQVAGWKTNMLRTYYHKAGKKALSLVNFGAGTGHRPDRV